MSSRFAKGVSKPAMIRGSGDWVLGGIGVGAATASAGFAAYMLVFGQALVESRSSISVVKPGSMLDGAGQVLSIEKRGEHWVVLTANGIIAQRR